MRPGFEGPVFERESPVELDAGGQRVRVTSPSKVMFPAAGVTKLELVQYYLKVAEGALTGVRNRPLALRRFPHGIGGEGFVQKRAPSSCPSFVKTVVLGWPMVVISDEAGLGWLANLGCVELTPQALRVNDLEHPDELRLDFEAGAQVAFPQVKSMVREVRDLLAAQGYSSWPKTSGTRGIHLQVRLEPRWTFDELNRAAQAIACAVERRAASLGVLLDFTQRAGQTMASAYSVRATADARVSAPFDWAELDALEPEDFTVKTMPARFLRRGEVGASIDSKRFSLEPLLELAARQHQGR